MTASAGNNHLHAEESVHSVQSTLLCIAQDIFSDLHRPNIIINHLYPYSIAMCCLARTIHQCSMSFSQSMDRQGHKQRLQTSHMQRRIWKAAMAKEKQNPYHPNQAFQLPANCAWYVPNIFVTNGCGWKNGREWVENACGWQLFHGLQHNCYIVPLMQVLHQQESQ